MHLFYILHLLLKASEKKWKAARIMTQTNERKIYEKWTKICKKKHVFFVRRCVAQRIAKCSRIGIVYFTLSSHYTSPTYLPSVCPTVFGLFFLLMLIKLRFLLHFCPRVIFLIVSLFHEDWCFNLVLRFTEQNLAAESSNSLT